MSIFSNLFKRKEEKLVGLDGNQNEIEDEIIAVISATMASINDDEEITAVIAAAIASMDENEEVVAAITAAIACVLGKRSTDFVVRNIMRTSNIDSLWALNGRMNLMR